MKPLALSGQPGRSWAGGNRLPFTSKNMFSVLFHHNNAYFAILSVLHKDLIAELCMIMV